MSPANWRAAPIRREPAAQLDNHLSSAILSGPHPNDAGAKGIGRSNASVPDKGPPTASSAPAIDLLHAMDDCLRQGQQDPKTGQHHTSSCSGPASILN